MAKSADQLQKENDELRAQLAKATGKQVAGMPVSGSYMANWTNDLTGAKMQRKVEFVPGAQGLRLRGHNGIFPTEEVLKIANGKKPSKEGLEKCPALESITQKFAAQELTHLAIIGYGLLKDNPVEVVPEEPEAPAK